jgi:hypothetical protein
VRSNRVFLANRDKSSTMAREALDTRNLALLLVWVQADDETEIRVVFEQTLARRRSWRPAISSRPSSVCTAPAKARLIPD